MAGTIIPVSRSSEVSNEERTAPDAWGHEPESGGPPSGGRRVPRQPRRGHRGAGADGAPRGCPGHPMMYGPEDFRLVLGALDHEWRLSEISPDATTWFGWNPAEYRGTALQSVVHPEDAPLLLLALWRIALEIAAAGIGDAPVSGEMWWSDPALRELSQRQLEILRRLLRGERVPTIARDLFLSQSTVRNHLSAIYRRLGVHSQAELLARLLPRWRGTANGRVATGLL